MLLNVAAFTISELLRENQQRKEEGWGGGVMGEWMGGGEELKLPPTQIRVKRCTVLYFLFIGT